MASSTVALMPTSSSSSSTPSTDGPSAFSFSPRGVRLSSSHSSSLSPRGSGGSAAVGSSSKSQPLSAGLFYQAACRAHDLGDLPAAIHLYTTAIDLDSRHIAAWIGRGVARKESRLYEQSISDYTRALQLSPTDSITLLILSNRANCLTAAGSFAAALTDHNSALSLHKDDAVLWCNRGSTLMKLGRLDEALLDFQRALDVDPAYAVAMYNLGLVHGRKGRINASMQSFSRAADIFRQTNNKAHAEDCERQMAYFGGTKYQPSSDTMAASAASSSSSASSGQLLTPRRSNAPPSIEISPLSPVHQRGITRTFHPGAVPSATPSAQRSAAPSPSPQATPSSRAPLHTGEITSELFESPDLVQAKQSPFLQRSSSNGSNDRYASLPYNLTSALTHASDSYDRDRPPPLTSTLSPLGEGGLSQHRSPASGSSPGSAVSDEPLISPTAKRPLPAVKPPNGHGMKHQRFSVKIHTPRGREELKSQ